MTPKEKAKSLYEAIHYKTPHILVEDAKDRLSKSCAIICCDEVIAVLNEIGYLPGGDNYDTLPYWQQVKAEIQKL